MDLENNYYKNCKSDSLSLFNLKGKDKINFNWVKQKNVRRRFLKVMLNKILLAGVYQKKKK